MEAIKLITDMARIKIAESESIKKLYLIMAWYKRNWNRMAEWLDNTDMAIAMLTQEARAAKISDR
jgi:hypothetical protein